MDLSSFERKIGFRFKKQGILRLAFTHRSYLNEHKLSRREHNERLEFLGDAVLELVVTDYLYRNYPHCSEGEMTAYRSALVNANTLSSLAKELGLNDHLLLSKGEARDTGRARKYILANTFEAVVGAIYLDQGFGKATEFIAKYLLPLTEKIIKSGSVIDAKSLFQEKAQEIVGLTPAYKTISETGPDHDKEFTVAVCLGQEVVAKGTGRSKQDAAQAAAEKALAVKGWK
jgi:ribonuclease-3